MEIRVAKPDEFSDVINFYHSIEGEENTTIQPTEQIVVALDEGIIIGAVRVCHEEGVLVLRTMYVLPQHRGKGIATELLHTAVHNIGNNECYCLPYPHMREFYERAGFIEIESQDLPKFLRERHAVYNQSFNVIAMKKANH